MLDKEIKRVFLVYNPNSSQYCHVKEEVLEQPEWLEGFKVGRYAIKKVPFVENLAEMKRVIRDGDLVMALGGDATAAVAANAILESGREATLAVLPYGNFNDLARTLGTMRKKDLNFKNTMTLYPLEVYVDGEFWRYATCYVTIGMTAEAVELFDEPKFRKYMQKGHKSSWRSYLKLAEWYFKNRHKKTFMPEFTVNGRRVVKKASDYAAVNGKSMCRVMKGGEDFLRPKVFRSKVDKLTSFPRLFKLMAQSILVRVPGKETKGDVLEFVQPATVELQAEGEYQVFKDVKKIEIRKGEKCLKVMRNLKK